MAKAYAVFHPRDNSHWLFDDKEEAINFAWRMMEEYEYEDDVSSNIFECEKLEDNAISFENKKLIGFVSYCEPELDFFEPVIQIGE